MCESNFCFWGREKFTALPEGGLSPLSRMSQNDAGEVVLGVDDVEIMVVMTTDGATKEKHRFDSVFGGGGPRRVALISCTTSRSALLFSSMTSIHMSHAEKAKMAHELRRTIRELKDRGLIVAAKWSVNPDHWVLLLTAGRQSY